MVRLGISQDLQGFSSIKNYDNFVTQVLFVIYFFKVDSSSSNDISIIVKVEHCLRKTLCLSFNCLLLIFLHLYKMVGQICHSLYHLKSTFSITKQIHWELRLSFSWAITKVCSKPQIEFLKIDIFQSLVPSQLLEKSWISKESQRKFPFLLFYSNLTLILWIFYLPSSRKKAAQSSYSDSCLLK